MKEKKEKKKNNQYKPKKAMTIAIGLTKKKIIYTGISNTYIFSTSIRTAQNTQTQVNFDSIIF